MTSSWEIRLPPGSVREVASTHKKGLTLFNQDPVEEEGVYHMDDGDRVLIVEVLLPPHPWSLGAYDPMPICHLFVSNWSGFVWADTLWNHSQPVV